MLLLATRTILLYHLSVATCLLRVLCLQETKLVPVLSKRVSITAFVLREMVEYRGIFLP